MNNHAKILIVDDERIALRNLEHVMKKEGYEVTGTQSGPNALKLLEERQFDVVLTDLRMEKVDGLQILRKTRELHPDTEVIMITGFATTDSAVETMRQGAFYYIAKPFKLEEVRKVVQEALHKVRLKTENRHLREQLDSYQGKIKIITQDPSMQKLLETARQIAPTDCNVLVTGESGTGKELFARAIHFNSRRQQKPFFPLNCSAIPDTLLESELFGYRKGAFTGADTDRAGILERARGGTVFLDEIAETSPAFQAKLLRVLQDGEYLPLGAVDLMRCDVRIVAATNKPLDRWVEEGKFREDLYYRVNGFEIALPPLSEQHRIVAKVDELMALCDELETRLTTTASTRRQLLEATLHETIEGGS